MKMIKHIVHAMKAVRRAAERRENSPKMLSNPMNTNNVNR